MAGKGAENEVARHYARVLLDTADAAGEQLEPLASGLEGMTRALEDSPELGSILASPAVPRARRARLAAAVAERLAAGRLLSRFVAVMVERERSGMIPAASAAFRAELDARAGTFKAEVVSARPLGAEARAGLAKALGEALSGRPRLTFREDPSLIGGFRVETGGRIYDASVSRELDRFAERHRAGLS